MEQAFAKALAKDKTDSALTDEKIGQEASTSTL